VTLRLDGAHTLMLDALVERAREQRRQSHLPGEVTQSDVLRQLVSDRWEAAQRGDAATDAADATSIPTDVSLAKLIDMYLSAAQSMPVNLYAVPLVREGEKAIPATFRTGGEVIFATLVVASERTARSEGLEVPLQEVIASGPATVLGHPVRVYLAPGVGAPAGNRT
jgi:hypothetical protein